LLGREVPKLNVGEDSKLRIVGLEALPTYKRAVVWFPGPWEDTDHLFQQLRRLNWGWTPASEGCMSARRNPVGQAVFSLLGVKTEGKK
jgi:hypothetical protein